MKIDKDYKPIYCKIVFITLLLSALILRLIFLGYSTLFHGEAENAEAVAYVMPCLKQFSYHEALWRLWHIFTNLNNPLAYLYPVNFSLAWFFGLNEFTIRLNAVIGGFISCIIIYILTKRHSDQRTALFALALVVFNPFLVIFNRYGYVDSVQVALTLLGILCIDTYTKNRRRYLLILSAFCFSIGFLVKFNTIVFIAIALLLYHFYFKLKAREIGLVVLFSVFFIFLIFIDQTNELLSSIWKARSYVKADTDISGFFSQKVDMVMRDALIYAKAYFLIYAEFIFFPIAISLIFWKRIENKFFRFLVLFSIFYFVVLIFQGRTFYRYLQMGIITSLSAFAFPLSRFTIKKYQHAGIAFLTVFIIWSIFTHRTYISTQYHHIPYKYITERANELSGSGCILIYGRNSETEYYLSPTHNLLHDESKNPCIETVTGVDDFPIWANSVRKIQPTIATLLDPSVVNSDDIVIVSGMQMAGGDPSPRLRSADGKIQRIYRHELESVKGFYKEYLANDRLRKEYVLLEKIFLTNGSNEIAVLILRKN
jgi:hypothetical protein